MLYEDSGRIATKISGKLFGYEQCIVRNSLTMLLKCNYKYKRRFNIGAFRCAKCTKKAKLSLFINFIEYLSPQRRKSMKQELNENLSVLCDNNDVDRHVDATNDDVNALDSLQNSHQRNYDKVSTSAAAGTARAVSNNSQATCLHACCAAQQAWQHLPTTATTTRTTTKTNIMSLFQCSRQISSLAATFSMSTRRWPFSWMTATTTTTAKATTSATTTTPSVNLMAILMTLFIALVLSAGSVQAGACWQSAMDNGKCSEIYSLNISRSDCCTKHPEFSFTEHDPSNLEYFFATTVGDGMSCAPCIESCKHITCGENKKCVKRKGRPKCICAPECGAAARRRARLKTQQQQQRHHMLQLVAEQPSSPAAAAARDIRSLSSEITHINLELEAPQSQRKLIKSVVKPSRLIMAANVEERTEKPTTRRLQIFSNVRQNLGGRGRNTSMRTIKKKQQQQQQPHLKAENSAHTTERHEKLPRKQQRKQRKHRNNKNKPKNEIPTSSRAVIKNNSNSPKHNHTTAVNMSLLDDVYDKYNVHGFPNTKTSLSHLAHFHATNPVCGTDGRTYNTECQLKKRACRTDNPYLSVAYRGHCRTTCNGIKCANGLTCVEDHYNIPHCIACKIDCPYDDDVDDDAALGHNFLLNTEHAVCGVDGKTYSSICDINRMICKIGRSIAVAYPGPCRSDRVSCADINCGPKHTCLVDLLTHEPRCVSCSYKCARKRRPSSRYEEGKLCGVNNRTYNSWCEMRKDSCATGYLIDVKTTGECQ